MNPTGLKHIFVANLLLCFQVSLMEPELSIVHRGGPGTPADTFDEDRPEKLGPVTDPPDEDGPEKVGPVTDPPDEPNGDRPVSPGSPISWPVASGIPNGDRPSVVESTEDWPCGNWSPGGEGINPGGNDADSSPIEPVFPDGSDEDWLDEDKFSEDRSGSVDERPDGDTRIKGDITEEGKSSHPFADSCGYRIVIISNEIMIKEKNKILNDKDNYLHSY